jgi:SAM-dependent methyltransferase
VIEASSIPHLGFQLASVVGNHILARISPRRRLRRTLEFVREEYEISTDNWNLVTTYLVPDNGKVLLVHDRLERSYEYLSKVFDSCIQDFGPGVSRILEIGCGEGYYLKHIKQNAPETSVYGIDLCPNRVRKTVRHAGPVEILSCIANAERLPFADESFDVAYTCYALEQMPSSIGQALKEMHRVVRRGIVLVEPFNSIQNIFGRLNNWNCDYVRDIPLHVERSGFRVTSTKRLSLGAPTNLAGLLVARK